MRPKMVERSPDGDKDDTHVSPWERFVGLTKHVVSVPKAEVDRREVAYGKKRQGKATSA